MKPFLLACGTRNPKFAGSGIVGLQRLVVSNALSKEALTEALEAFRECATLPLDIQLKVLQALPSLLQNYAGSLTGKLLLTAFQVCFLLYNSKTAVVSNTAAASLQQLVNSTFEKTSEKGESQHRDDSSVEVPIGDGTSTIYGAALDAYRLLEDICLLTDGRRPKHLITASLVQNFGLELLEPVLASHAHTVMEHPEQIHVLRLRLMPLIIRMLSERANFSTTVRVMRLVQPIISHLMFALAPECEMVLSLLNHMLDADAAVVWKRALCLEVFRTIHSEPALIRSIHAHYDGTDERRNILRDHLGSLVRLTSENPAAIGLGQQSSIPTALGQIDDSGDQAAVQAGGLVGSIGASVAATDFDRLGLSHQWSTLRVSCIDLLDKSEPPDLPATYIYSLTLTCVTMFSEGLARFLMPFSIPSNTKSRRKQTTEQAVPEKDNRDEHLDMNPSKPQSHGGRKVPINPLTLKQHVLYDQISTSGQIMEHCWPAVLAASSAFLNATLDSEYYHSLIRAFQRFTQVAGLLELTTPRDAFLTTLGKHAIPPLIGAKAASQRNLNENKHDFSPNPGNDKRSINPETSKMTTRHFLCLRALLNLGIALGPGLEQSWIIILDTLLQADLVLSLSGQARRKKTKRLASTGEDEAAADRTDSVEDLGIEMTAAEAAASRLFETTFDLSDEAFLEFLTCLCSLLDTHTETNPRANELPSPKPKPHKHKKVRSTTGFTMEGGASAYGNGFVVDKLHDVIQSNVVRFLQPETAKSGWNLLLEVLSETIDLQSARPDIRIKAATALNDLLVTVSVSQESLTPEERDAVRNRSLRALLSETTFLQTSRAQSNNSNQNCEVEIHRLALESLKTILEHCGDALDTGWSSVLAIIDSIFQVSSDDAHTAQLPSLKLVRPAFDSLQLVCSDFLSFVPISHFMTLLDTLHAFCAQNQDLNISLTTATFFRNVSDYLQRDGQSITLDPIWSDNFSNVDLTILARQPNIEKSTPALWVYLLLRLKLLSTDSRLEVRHSALHTLFRIFDACFDQLATSSVGICFKIVLIKMLEANEECYRNVKDETLPERAESLSRSWNLTAIVEIEGTTEFLSQCLQGNEKNRVLADMCRELLTQFMIILQRRTLDIGRAIHTGTSKILSTMNSTKGLIDIGHPIIEKGWEMWELSNPASYQDDSERKRNDNQDALIPYLRSLHELLRLTGQRLPFEQIESIKEELRVSVIQSTATAYSVDIDRMTPTQDLVLRSLEMIPTTDPKAVAELVQSITSLITLAYEQDEDPSGKKLTYVSLSKTAMTLLESFVIKHLRRRHIDLIRIVFEAITALAIPIRLKYQWRLEGKGLSPWKKATKTALAILEAAMPLARESEEEVASLWEAVVQISDGVVSANCDACINVEDIPSDRDFDIEAFSRMQRIIIPALGSSTIPDTIRQKFTESLFKNSIIHEPHVDDLAGPGQDLLEGLQSTHIGRVNHLPASPRSKLSYLLLDELFDLVAGKDGTSEHIKLAQAAAPYLILRAGLTLKAYVMDHPLRGRMPQPSSQKREMFHILRKLIELDSEPKAIPAAPGISSKNKKHLHILYPLVMQALKAAWRDEAMTKALQDVLDAVGDDFGV